MIEVTVITNGKGAFLKVSKASFDNNNEAYVRHGWKKATDKEIKENFKLEEVVNKKRKKKEAPKETEEQTSDSDN